MATAITLKRQIRTIKMTKVKGITTSTKSIKTGKTISSNLVAVDIMMKRGYYWFKNYLRSPLTWHSGYYNADASNQHQNEGGYYDAGQQGYQDEYYNDQYYDQGTPAAGQQPQYGHGGYGFVNQVQFDPTKS